MKKILATILALVMALALTATVWADGDGTASGSMTGADFLAKAKNGAITLADDVTLSTSCSISDGQTYTINLNGHTLSADNTTIMLRHGKLIVNGTGTIKENAPNFGAIMIKGSVNNADTNYSVVEVNAGVILEGWSPIFVDQNAKKAYGVSVTVNGATLNARKDTAGASGTGVYVNGQIADENNAPVISLTNTKICDVDNASQGMYLAGYATTTLTNCDITGVTGVEIRAGKLTVSGGAITGTATPVTVTPDGNGSTTVGAGIALAQHTTKLPVIVTIENATVKGYTGVYESNPQKNDADSIAKVNLTISGGNFEAINNGTNAVHSEDCTNFISGGTFSSAVDTTYLADTVNYKVSGTNSVSYFTNLNDAVAAAGADDEVKNLKETPAHAGSTVTLKDGETVITTLHTEAATVDLPTLTKTGYTFKGWKDEDGKVYNGKLTISEENGGELVVREAVTLTAVWSANSYYYYPSTSTTDSTTGKASPKTFDAGIGVYAGMALASLTGLAYTGKKKF